MSSHVETVKAMYAAFGQGDIHTVLSHVTDDVLWSSEGNEKISWSGARHGRTAAAGFFAGLATDLTEHDLQMTEFLAQGDIVAVFGRYSATVKNNGIRVSSPVAHYFRFKDGKVAEFRNFVNTAAFSDAMSSSAASA